MTNSVFDFTDRLVLVTGGSKGIGRACVELFALGGADVLFTYRRKDNSVDVLLEWAGTTSGKVTGLRSDALVAKDRKTLHKFVEDREGGHLDILVNNVGDAIRRSSFEQSDEVLWQRSFDINLGTATSLTRAFLPMLKKSAGGVVVNISSIAGKTTGAGDSLHYGVSKAALDTFTVGLAREVKGTNLRIVGVAPSAIDTDFQVRHSSDNRLHKIIEQTPLGRIGTAKEVANVVGFLASDLASYISGVVVPITGGR